MMPLPISFIVYGTVTNNSGAILNGASVSVSTESVLANASGKYQLNIQDVANDGGTITVIASYGGRTSQSQFVLDLDDISKNLNFIILFSSRQSITSSGKRLSVIKSSNKKFYINRV